MNMLLFFIFGICLGSFIPCFAERRQKHLSQQGRSYCMSCKHPLTAKDLIPIASFIFYHGRCRYCHAPIPKMFPIIECISGFVGIIIACSSPFFIHNMFLLMCYACLLLLSLDDVTTQHIHDIDLLLLACILLIDTILFGPHQWLNQLIGAFILSIPLFVITYIWPHSLGSGDSIFMLITGFYLGLTGITIAFCIGTISALCFSILLLLTKNASRKTAIPLIPFLSFGVITTIFLVSFHFI